MPLRGDATYTPDELQAKIDEYFAWCQAPEQKTFAVTGKHIIDIPRIPMWVDMAVYLGLSRETLRRWLDGDYHNIGDRSGLSTDDIANKEAEAQNRVRDILSRARDRIINDAYVGASRGVYNERATALRLGRMGETPKTEVQHSGNMTVAWDGVSAADADQYAR